ncbi:AzlC family ABC transporter permease [Pseudoroseomonas cervicalis]|uniref:AzlC family ABC transporter permease n=1 Tax=Teichococcus cervicalis TaxID=204525 RepID=UPI0027806384|nr:AzlC family ABC transporter permease [Pseudoroseomonas cervicalis]MDQ1081354.1 putative branched-subunit amino acid permease [Pseudoroseomonas cervicalis]
MRPRRPGPPFTLAGVRHGFVRAQALAPGVLLYGVVFGILASEAQLSALAATLTSALVYSGSAQMAALQVWRDNAGLLPLFAAILLMNARYLLYGASLRPWLEGLPPGTAYGTLFFLGDGNWALAMAERAEGREDAGFLFGSGVAMFLPWVGGTLAGRLAGGLLGDPARFGMDFMLVAFSAALLVGLWRSRADLAPIAAAALAAALLHGLLPGGWLIVATALAACIAGAALHRPSPAPATPPAVP